MKYFLVSSPRCGSHYCGEAIALRTQVLALGECLNSMYHDSAFTFENNQVQVLIQLWSYQYLPHWAISFRI